MAHTPSDTETPAVTHAATHDTHPFASFVAHVALRVLVYLIFGLAGTLMLLGLGIIGFVLVVVRGLETPVDLTLGVRLAVAALGVASIGVVVLWLGRNR